MKIYLASFLQPFFHGPGRKISISDSKPNDFVVDAAFKPFIPNRSIINHYYDLKNEDQDKAANFFVSCFESQLNDFLFDVKEEAEKNNQDIIELLPFKDGDTLLSWERYERFNYRKSVANVLQKMGYEVELK